MVDYILKVVVIGDEGVGKSSLLHLFNYGEYKEFVQPTIGVDFFSTVVNWNNNNVKVQLWDTSGNKNYSGIVNSYFQNSIGAIIIFKDDQSYLNIEKWILQYKSFNKDYHSFVVVNNSKKEYDVKHLQKRYGIQYIDKSDLAAAFKTLVEMVLEDFRSQPLKFKQLESFKQFKNDGNKYVRFYDESEENVGCCYKCVIL